MRFVKIEHETMDRALAAGGPSALAVYLAYRRITGEREDGASWSTDAYVAGLAGVSVTTLKTRRRRLEEAGLIDVERDERDPRRLRVTLTDDDFKRANERNYRDAARLDPEPNRDAARLDPKPIEAPRDSDRGAARLGALLDNKNPDQEPLDRDHATADIARLPAPPRPVQLPLIGAEGPAFEADDRMPARLHPDPLIRQFGWVNVAYAKAMIARWEPSRLRQEQELAGQVPAERTG